MSNRKITTEAVAYCSGLIAAAALLTSPRVLAANPADAGSTLGLKPGLWQVELTYQSLNGRQVLDDQDLFARLLASVDPTTLALDRVNTALAQSGCANGVNSGGGSFASQMGTANSQNTRAMPNCTLPYAMRMQSEAAINESGADEGASSSYRICLTPALAQLDVPVLDAQEPVAVRARFIMMASARRLLSAAAAPARSSPARASRTAPSSAIS